MNKLSILLLAAATVTTAVAALPAEARQRGGSVSVQGQNGRGGTVSRSVDRQPGSSTVSRSTQTNSGRGATTTRGGSVSDGTYNGGATHTLNNGTSFGRSTTATGNGDGSGSFSSTATGPNGQSRTVSGTVTKVP